jgi:hypothetical protein
MELSLAMKLRIFGAVATGVIVIGLLGWPLAAPHGSDGVVSLLSGAMTVSGAVALVGLAALTGFAAYFFSWPNGREIGVLAVPAGLAIWAVRCGDMASLVQHNSSLGERAALFSSLRLEPIFWLLVVGAGFGGVFVADKISGRGEPSEKSEKPKSGTSRYVNMLIALVGSVLVSHFSIRILAQDVRVFDSKVGLVVAQPAVGQIVFAVLVSFGLAAFVFKRFLDVSYVWPIAASGLVTGFAITMHMREEALAHLVEHWPATFFTNSAISILPLQMVAFGALGSIAGYWMAVRYNYWRKHGI